MCRCPDLCGAPAHARYSGRNLEQRRNDPDIPNETYVCQCANALFLGLPGTTAACSRYVTTDYSLLRSWE